jgi:hypothetical protein
MEASEALSEGAHARTERSNRGTPQRRDDPFQRDELAESREHRAGTGA